MKKKRYFIIAVAVLILMCGAYALLARGGDGEADEKNDVETVAIGTGQKIISLYMSPENEKAYEITSKDEESGGRSVWLSGYDESMAINVNEAGKLLATLETLKAYAEIEGEPEDYGITDDGSFAVMNYEDGSKMTLLFGGKTPVEGRAYVQALETGKIYTIREDISKLCARPVTALRKAQLAADFFGTSEAFAADSIEIKTSQEQLAIRKQTQAEKDASLSDSPSYYRMTAPAERECSDGRVSENVIAAVLRLDESAAVVEDFPEDLSVYGLGDGCGSILISAADKECRLLIGKENEEGRIYIMRSDIPTVMAAASEDMSMLTIKWYDLIDVSVWMRSIDKVESISVNAGGVSYEMKFARNENGELTGGSVNGKDISETAVRDIYSKILNVHIEGFSEDISASELKSKSKDYTITLHLLDGRNEKADFYAIDARSYGIDAGENFGEGFYTNISSLSDLEKEIKAAF